MASSSLRHHMERSHGNILTHILGLDVGGGGLEMCVVLLPRVLTVMKISVEGCLERAHNPGRICENFMYSHGKSKIATLQQIPATLHQYDTFGIHMQAERLGKHKYTSKCDRAT